jgi:hypothetical protein
MEAIYGILVGVVMAFLYIQTRKKDSIDDKTDVLDRQSKSNGVLDGRVRDALAAIDRFRAARKELGPGTDDDGKT